MESHYHEDHKTLNINVPCFYRYMSLYQGKETKQCTELGPAISPRKKKGGGGVISQSFLRGSTVFLYYSNFKPSLFYFKIFIFPHDIEIPCITCI